MYKISAANALASISATDFLELQVQSVQDHSDSHIAKIYNIASSCRLVHVSDVDDAKSRLRDELEPYRHTLPSGSRRICVSV